MLLMTSSEKYGLDKSTHPDGLPNFIYGSKTGNSNLRRHLRIRHAEEYDKAVVQHKWGYRLSNDTSEASKLDARNKRSLDIPSYSPAVFREYLVRFIVADDQVGPDNLAFFHAYISSVDSCCRMPRVSTVVYDPSRKSRRRRHPSPW
jgi:hypothetical protein